MILKYQSQNDSPSFAGWDQVGPGGIRWNQNCSGASQGFWIGLGFVVFDELLGAS